MVRQRIWNALSWLSVLAAWVLCVFQLQSAMMVHSTGNTILVPGALVLALYLPAFLVYFLAKFYSGRAPFWAIALAPAVGIGALFLV